MTSIAVYYEVSSVNTILKDLNSKDSLLPASAKGSNRSRTVVLPEATVLLIDILNFTTQCATLPAGKVGEWVAAFYRLVHAAASTHGIAIVEIRGDCCVCVAGAEGAAPSRRRREKSAAAADTPADQATRMLAFAARLHADLAGFAGAGGPILTRMGVATGPLALLTIGDGSADGAAGFTSARGDAAEAAARMEALAAPGRARVHQSTAGRWAAEAPGRPAPPTASVYCADPALGPQRAAVYDCAARAFLPAPAPPPAAAPAAAGGGRALRLRAVLSAKF